MHDYDYIDGDSCDLLLKHLRRSPVIRETGEGDMHGVIREVAGTIRLGRVYVFVGGIPADCTGHLYMAKHSTMAVPAYQRQIVVEALTGPDRGKWFSCSEVNFVRRYRLATDDDKAAYCSQPVAEEVA